MKEEIIYTDDYALILSDEQTKENDWGYIQFQGGDVKLIGKYFADDWLKVIAHRPLTDAPILEGVPLLPEFSKEDDVEKEAKDYADNSATCDYEEGINVGKYQGFLEGYNKAKETYKYTVDDMIACWKYASMDKHQIIGNQIGDHYLSFIQSLQQPKRFKYFKCEIDNILSYNADDGVNALVNPSFGKRKTIINSQGQTELVGSYIY
jgi:hypothetical protein